MKIPMILLIYENGGYTYQPKTLDRIFGSKYSFWWHKLYKIEREIVELLWTFQFGV